MQHTISRIVAVTGTVYLEPLRVELEESAAAGDATAIGKSAMLLRNGERVTE